MIKVLHLITSLDTGGAEVMLYRLLSRIDRLKFHNSVASLTEDGPVGDRIRELGVPVYSIGMRRGSPNPHGIWRTWCLLRRERPAVLQTWLYHSDLVGLIAGRAAGIRSIAWNLRCSDTGEMYEKGLNGMVFRALVWLSRWTNLVIVNSQAGKRFHETCGYAPAKWEVVPNGYDTEEFRPRVDAGNWLRWELGLLDSHILIGLVARYDPLKDHRNFLMAAEQFLQVCPDARFIMVGSGVTPSNPELVAQIEKFHLAGRVSLLGERSDVAHITAGFDIANCTSLSEGFPNVVAEAMSCGVPCVATDVGDVALLLGDSGKVVPSGSPESLMTAWQELAVSGIGQRRELGTRARDRVLAQYSLETMARRYEDLYASLTTPDL